MKAGWAADTARKIGLGGEVDFTTTRVGMTLHIPCCEGHVVDFTVRPGLAPQGVVKSMLAKGWTVGSKLKCPEHGRKKKPQPPSNPLREALKDVPMSWETKPPKVAMTPQERGAARWVGVPAEERRAHMAALRQRKEEKKKEIPPPMETAKVVPMATVESQPVTPAATATMSDNAKRCHRLVMQALEDFYDEKQKCYRPGHSDTSIANEIGVSKASVIKTREEYSGPLVEKMPPEVGELIREIRVLKGELANFYEDKMKAINSLDSRIVNLCRNKGWDA